jgi:amidase
MPRITHEQSGAFIERFTIRPTKSGPLDSYNFAVKDIIDVAEYRTSCGNPRRLETHPPAKVSAVCVEQLLAAGATCIGKVITDEFAFSLLGENHHHGTPLNPAAPNRVPGGSSSGSASAVACGLVDFALGTDTGGSVRVPASNCGIWGWRPSHDVISVAGVMPFAPTLDTVGILAFSAELLHTAGAVLLAADVKDNGAPHFADSILLVDEAFALADAEVREVFQEPIGRLRATSMSLAKLCEDGSAADLSNWLTIYRVLQACEFDSCLGSWIADVKPALGPAMTAGLEYVKKIDRTRVGESIRLREHYSRCLNAALADGRILCMPTTPTIAPLKGSKAYDRSSDYYARTLSLTAIAGVARLPQVTMPLGTVGGVPIGLSLLAARGEDERLLATVAHLEKRLR